MKLIGMLDSPYVRRVAISLQLLGLRFEHEALSVFRHFDEFRRINPVVKVPTLVCDDGTVLMDSTLILQYAEALARPRSLLPAGTDALAHDLRLTGLALMAAEKAVQILYERGLRPPEKQHEPWLERVSTQLLGALQALEDEVAREPLDLAPQAITQAAVAIAVAWDFAQRRAGDLVPAARFPALAGLSARAEALPAFRAAPFGEAPMHAAAA